MGASAKAPAGLGCRCAALSCSGRSAASALSLAVPSAAPASRPCCRAAAAILVLPSPAARGSARRKVRFDRRRHNCSSNLEQRIDLSKGVGLLSQRRPNRGAPHPFEGHCEGRGRGCTAPKFAMCETALVSGDGGRDGAARSGSRMPAGLLPAERARHTPTGSTLHLELLVVVLRTAPAPLFHRPHHMQAGCTDLAPCCAGRDALSVGPSSSHAQRSCAGILPSLPVRQLDPAGHHPAAPELAAGTAS